MVPSGAVGIGWLALLAVAGVGYWLWDRRRHKGADGPRDAFEPSGGGSVDPATGRRRHREEDDGGAG